MQAGNIVATERGSRADVGPFETASRTILIVDDEIFTREYHAARLGEADYRMKMEADAMAHLTGPPPIVLLKPFASAILLEVTRKILTAPPFPQA
jgi:hypothetical protein